MDHQLPLDLPTPNAAEVDKFSRLYHERFGTLLTPDKAYEKCLRLMQLVYLTQFRRPSELANHVGNS